MSRVVSHEVVIAGGGPTGMTLAGELALAGVDVAIVERRVDQDLVGARAGGLLARTIEEFDQRGIADRFLSEGRVVQIAQFAGVPVGIADFPSRHNYVLGLWQKHIERILAGWVAERDVPTYRGRDVIGFTQDEDGVEVQLSDGHALRSRYLVGCDGGRSLVRKTAGIDFPGWDPSTSALLAEVRLTDEPEWGIRRDALGQHGFAPLQDGLVRVMVTEPSVGRSSQPTLQDLREALIVVFGTDYGVHSPVSISRFTDMTRQAATYRLGRILLAGDAAHVHSPDGGQGLNTGVQDAMNLGWKLAQVVKHRTPDGLLDSYHAERHPVAARAIRATMALVALRRPDDRVKALGEIVAELLSIDEARKRLAGLLSGLDIHYDLGEGHALLGRRMPDLDLMTADGPVRMFTLLHDARPVLLNLGEPGDLDTTSRPWADRVRVVDASYAGAWELPVLGTVPAPTGVLIRPDGYVAWVGARSQQGLADALSSSFGRLVPLDPARSSIPTGCGRAHQQTTAAR